MLGTQLRRLREELGITREAAGDAIRASHAKISRLELGRVGFKERDIADLLTLYGVDDAEERDRWMQLVRQANEPNWWHRYTDVLPSWFELYLRLEQAASIIRSYQVQFVPGLLQSEQYARAVIVQGHGGEDAEEIDRRVNLRMTRQKLLTEPDAPRFWAVIDEAALRRAFGSPAVMQEQIGHLLELAEIPSVTIQVLPFSSGGHAAAGGPFTVLRFAERDLPDIVYLEQLTSAMYLEKRPEVEVYLRTMERITVQAETPNASKDMLRSLLDEL
ncbi:helix-turn-helix transcriptional regulator [Pseudonocardia sp.]|uniref:helix-turn-helix domain-containing protein n=1 Tax=Pseudonocardia sp. TaxID=60912 RepID=UPI0031FD0A58